MAKPTLFVVVEFFYLVSLMVFLSFLMMTLALVIAKASQLSLEAVVRFALSIFAGQNSERYKSEQTASIQELIQCIKAHKTIVVPVNGENYFAKLKTLANAKKLTITKITPYYQHGVLGDSPNQILYPLNL